MAALAFMAFALPVEASAEDRGRVGIWQPVVERLVEDGVEREYAEALFSREALEFDPDHMGHKMRALLKTKQAVKGVRKAEEPQVMERYLNPILIAGAYAYLRDNRETLESAYERYGVDGDHIVALLLVETRLGTNTGRHKAMPVLASMALAGDFALIEEQFVDVTMSEDMKRWLVERTRQKGDWAYGELLALVEYARQNAQDPFTIPGSLYGAIGICQFMPSTAKHYGVDGDGDGRVDLFEKADALHSMANYLKEHGWKKGMSEEQRLKVIYRYNHSMSYAMTVDAVADKLRRTRELFGG